MKQTIYFKEQTSDEVMSWDVVETDEGFHVDSVSGDLENGYWSSIEAIKDYINEGDTEIIENYLTDKEIKKNIDYSFENGEFCFDADTDSIIEFFGRNISDAGIIELINGFGYEVELVKGNMSYFKVTK